MSLNFIGWFKLQEMQTMCKPKKYFFNNKIKANKSLFSDCFLSSFTCFLSQIELKNMKYTFPRIAIVRKYTSFKNGAVCYAKARFNRLRVKVPHCIN